ncbi:MAG: hypothetical protein JSR85_03905 [Proteobacteria bacterium]|nr:hypothetical protein [Pseudomonadota bacterium]
MNLFFYIAFFCCFFVFSAEKVLSNPLLDKDAIALIDKCKTSIAKYELGIKFRNGQIKGYTKDTPEALRPAISCFLPEAKIGNERAMHNIGMALWKLGLSDAASPFFSMASQKGLKESENNKQKLKEAKGSKKKQDLTLAYFGDNLFKTDAQDLIMIVKKFRELRRVSKFKCLDDFVLTPTELTKGYTEKSEEGVSIYFVFECLQPLEDKLPPLNVSTKKQLHHLELIFSNYVADFQNRCIETLGEERESEESNTPSRDPTIIINTYNSKLKPLIKTLLKISNSIFKLLMHYERIPADTLHGLINCRDNGSLGYIRDSSEDNFLPFYVPPLTRPFQLFTLPLRIPSPYYQGAVLMNLSCSNSFNIISSPGFIVIYDEDFKVNSDPNSTPFELKLYSGAYSSPYFSVSSYSHLLDPNELFQDNLTKLALSVFTADELNQLKTKKQDLLFAPLATPAEEEGDLFEILVLEDLIKIQKNTTHKDHLKALEYIAAIEEQEGKAIADILQECIAPILNSYEEAVSKEQREISEMVKKDQVPGCKKNKSRKNVNKKKKKAKLKQKSNSPSLKPFDPEREALKRFEEYKQKGRLKYTKALSLINLIMKEYSASRFLLKPNVSGSHVNFHAENAKTTATFVKLHGSEDNTIPARRFNTFGRRLLETILH